MELSFDSGAKRGSWRVRVGERKRVMMIMAMKNLQRGWSSMSSILLGVGMESWCFKGI